ncbi:MAG: mandelate racemase/muconate lactonizing enzyme family protein [Variovorax sp.]
MRIAEVVTGTYRIPLAEAWVSAKYRITHHEYVVTEVRTECGETGAGWCQTIGLGGLAIEQLVCAYLAPTLVGEDPANTERIWSRLWDECHFLGPAGITTLALATVDIALWDIKAKVAGMPLYRLLGGVADSVGVYASAVNLHLTQDELLAQVEEQLAQGYTTFKLKIGRGDPVEDLERMRAVRKLIGPSRTLLLDVNQRWTSGEALVRLKSLAEVNPGWIEEPMLSDDVAGHAHLRRTCGVPIAVGEQLGSRYDFWAYIRGEAADILQPNVWKVGGVGEWMKIAHAAQLANLVVAPHNSLELSCHLVGAIRNGFMVENIFGGNLSDLGVVEEPVNVVNGRIALPQQPGHGVIFQRDKLETHRLEPGKPVSRESSVHAGL